MPSTPAIFYLVDALRRSVALGLLPAIGFVVPISLALALPGCHERRSAPERSEAASAQTPVPAPSATTAASRAAQARFDSLPRDLIEPTSSASAHGAWSGGTWESCYAGYAPSGDPGKDVLRLGLLCGPYHGMREVRPDDSGRLGASEEHVRDFGAKQGACFRVVAVCDAAMGAVQVEMLGADDRVEARSAAGRWVVLPARGPWCAERDEDVRIRLRAEGIGSYAMQLWMLP